MFSCILRTLTPISNCKSKLNVYPYISRVKLKRNTSISLRIDCQTLWGRGFEQASLYSRDFILDNGPPWDIMFFGTDEFAVESLKILREDQKRGVVGQLDVVSVKLKKITPAVRKYCHQERIPISDWPVTVFPSQYHLGVVVSFGHLIPETIIDAFPLGILNVHGSLLPRWRGAAPVIHAIMNNDMETGVTIMKIHPNRFDVGEIVSQIHIPIGWDTKSGQLTMDMANLGAQELKNVINDLKSKLNQEIKQVNKGVTKAPKVHEATAEILWEEEDCRRIQAKYRALDDHFPLWTTWVGKTVKLRSLAMKEELFQTKSEVVQSQSAKQSLQIFTDGNSAVIDDLALKKGQWSDEDKNKMMELYQHNTSEKLREILIPKISQETNTEKLENKVVDKKKNTIEFLGQKIVPGSIVYNKQRKVLSVYCKDGWVDFGRVIIKGKKPMSAGDFYNGFVSKVGKDKQHFNNTC